MRGDRVHPVRLRYAKHGKVRWLGHRDLARAFERAFRVAELPLAFTEGFNPHPKVSFGLALSVGFESDAEYLDVALTRPIDAGALPSRVRAALPVGVEVTGAAALADRAPSLQESVTAVGWRVAVDAADTDAQRPQAVREAFARAQEAPELPTKRQRKGRVVTEDVKPAIRRLDVVGPSRAAAGVLGLELECATHPRSPKPNEVLDACAAAEPALRSLAVERVLRTHQWIERDGTRREPLEADPRPHARQVRAS